MGTPLVRLLLLLPLVSSLAIAAPPSVQKRMGRRAETQALVEQVIDGALPVPTAISRLRVLREEPYAAQQLARGISQEMDPRRLRDLTAVLAGLETRAAEPLLAQLAGHEDSAVRMYAAQGLGRLGSKRVDVLLPLLQDKSYGVRREVARALGASHDPRVGKTLVTQARTEADPQTRVWMLEAVGAAGDKKQAKALEAFLDDSSESTRFAAARGLCLLGAPEGFAFAKKLLASEDRLVRRQGLGLYEGLPVKQTGPALRPLLEDKDRGLAAGAARILAQGGDKTMVSWLVLASWNANGEEKLTYEKELETLQLADDERKAILRAAGVAK
ncbi:HEAT repeat domain protein [Cystobacter fuscus DSM 2262]|uniref:HEAT repeat domain protein n=1 Tax=Cystobacter fuscus (strain ATCC 25194 / DSM 2262 / NBRC 100088 / M29) TaxID=1242864 RepID=S9PHR9_CYSF2|nr:HEAT repeat domain-containing protein [Cystobacter fuscus]EPX62591.1 HEAT repeat domain protein [Cystobacter fuscus DSM 2262]